LNIAPKQKQVGGVAMLADELRQEACEEQRDLRIQEVAKDASAERNAVAQERWRGPVRGHSVVDS
jgi:hypothetical protein